jgi:hypothetical protein
VSAALRTLDSLREHALQAARLALAGCQQELTRQREARDVARDKRVSLELSLSQLRERFAACSSLRELRWLEASLEVTAAQLQTARALETRLGQRVLESEHRLHDAEARLREQAVARRAVSHVLDKERAQLEQRAERAAEEDAADVFRSRVHHAG